MKQLLNVYKPQGLTPLQVIQLFKKQFPKYKEQPIGYAGRLDPLAHGVLLLMVGEETTKQKDTYLNLPKEYEFEIILGITTDTYDALGLVQSKDCHPELVSGSSKQKMLNQVQHDINLFIKSKLGKQPQTYPPYSSKTVQGKPLHWWAKNNKLSEITIPTRDIEIFRFFLLDIKTITAANLKKDITQQIASVSGDFRQKEILETWEKFFELHNYSFKTARFYISCSSGTYMRSLTNQLGKELGCGAITLDILRTKVGEYNLHDSLRV